MARSNIRSLADASPFSVIFLLHSFFDCGKFIVASRVGRIKIFELSNPHCFCGQTEPVLMNVCGGIFWRQHNDNAPSYHDGYVSHLSLILINRRPIKAPFYHRQIKVNRPVILWHLPTFNYIGTNIGLWTVIRRLKKLSKYYEYSGASEPNHTLNTITKHFVKAKPQDRSCIRVVPA